MENYDIDLKSQKVTVESSSLSSDDILKLIEKTGKVRKSGIDRARMILILILIYTDADEQE